MTIFRIVGLALVGVTITLIVRAYRPDIAIQVSIALGIVIIIAALDAFTDVFSQINGIVAKYGLNADYIKTIFKIVGLAYLTQFASDICSDAGDGALSSKVELAGRLMIMTVSIPAVVSILEIVSSLLAV